MKTCLFFFAIILFPFFGIAQENAVNNKNSELSVSDSLRIAELDEYWSALSKTVQEGDLEGYAAAYHEDAVVVLGSSKSVPIKEAIEDWAQGFIDTKAGKATSNVEFKFSERIGDETTAYEKGMFYFTLKNDSGKTQESYANFDALLVKKDGTWLCVMEYQKTPATKEEWNSLK